MKPLFTIFIFFVLLKVQRTYSIGLQIGDINFGNNESNDELSNKAQNAYGGHILEIGQLSSEQIASMIPHLEAVVNAAQGNPLSDVFKYMQEFCTEHAKLKPLSEITNNIQAFITRSGYKPNSRDSDVEHDKTPVFSATSINSNTEEIKAIFDDNDYDLKIKIANENRDENIKKAEKKRADALAKVDADKKRAQQENKAALQKVHEKYKQAYAAAENICQDQIKQFQVEIKSIDREYDEVKKKADKMMHQAIDDKNAIKQAADQDYQDAIAMAKKELDSAKAKYQNMIAGGEKRFKYVENQARLKRQAMEKQYQMALDRNNLPNQARERIEEAMYRAENAYQQAINQANIGWEKAQNAAEKYYRDALMKSQSDIEIAENELNEAAMEAYNLEKEAIDEYNTIISNAQMELYKKRQLAEAKQSQACGEEQYYAAQTADKVKNEANERLQNQQMEIERLAEKNFERIETEYHEDIEKILQEYHDAWSKADSLQYVNDEITVSQIIPSRKATRNKKNATLM